MLKIMHAYPTPHTLRIKRKIMSTLIEMLNIPVYFLLVIILCFKLLTWLLVLESFMHYYPFNSEVDNILHHWHWIQVLDHDIN